MELPVAYATALRLRAAGADPALIARALGIEAEGVGPLLALAETKLLRLLELEVEDGSPAEGGGRS